MLEATADGADAKDEERGTPVASRTRRLQRLIGTATSPGILAPFTARRTGGRTSPHRLMPISPAVGGDALHTKHEPSDAPASEEKRGVSKLGKLDVEAVSKCRSEVSKRRFGWHLLPTEHVEAVEAGLRSASKPASKRCRSAPTSPSERRRAKSRAAE